MLTIADVIEALTGERPPRANHVITEATVDSRQVIPGGLFIALPGERADGHDYVPDAFQRGAQVVLIQHAIPQAYEIRSKTVKLVDLRLVSDTSMIQDLDVEPPLCLLVEDSLDALQKVARFWRRKLRLRVIGITGSVGKSTTKELVAEVLSRRYKTIKNPGNLNNEIGLPLTILQATEGYERAVLEMGFYIPGEIAFLCEIALPYIGVITNIGTVHAERAGSQDAIAQGKAELVQALPAKPNGVAVLNYDDPLVRRMAEQTQAEVFFYGLSQESHLWADHIESLGLDGIRLRLHYRNEELHLRVPLIGRHSVHTVLRAAAVGLVENLTWQEVVDGLRSEHTQLRLVAVRTQSGALILDDTYNASPESSLAALNLLEEMNGHKVAVLGDMLELGPYEVQGHEMVGMRAAQIVDQLITIGERGALIASAARKAGMPADAISQLENPGEAIEFLADRLGPQDVVLIKGSHGMRMDRIVAALETDT